MKAFVYETYGSPDVLRTQQVDKPIPKANEILVKIQAVSLNPADWRMLRSIPFLIRFETGLTKPKFGILGSDIAGQVEAVGVNVTQFKVGEEVFGDIRTGGFADYVVTTPDKLILKPTNLSFEEAAAVPKAANTALQAVRDYGQVQAGQTILINGASGGVGTFAIQIAKTYGATVTAVCSTQNLELVRSIGADHVIDYTKNNFADGSQRYDLILDVVGNRSVADYQRALNPDGKALIIGLVTMGHMFKSMLVGMWVSKRSDQTISSMNAEINQQDLSVLKDLIEGGDVKPVIDRCYGFNQIPDAMTYLETGRARGKVVVQMRRH